MTPIREQLRRHSVALISLAVALSSLGYNTWRNERTEANRNLRAAGFELVREIGGLQEVVFYARFSPGDARGDARTGWAAVLTIVDLAALLPAEVGSDARHLEERWRTDWQALPADGEAHARIDGSIDRLRASTLAALRSLD